MNKKYIYMLACTLMLSGTACEKEFLEILPEDQPTADAYYNTESEIRSVTASLYGRPWFEYNDKFSWVAGDGMAGDLYNDYQHEGQMFFFSFSDNNNIISQGWRGLYNIVAFSNSIINDMPRIASSKGVSEEVINRGLGEARFIRGFTYYLLTEYWEEVPIIENAAALVASGNIQVPKHTNESLYKFIIRDLEFAAQNLPASDMPGRVTEWSAKGMLAKVYLTRAQKTGSAEDFAKAMSYADDVIRNSGLTLMSNYADLFKIENNNNPESLFALQWIAGTWGHGNSRQAVFARNSRITNNSEAWGGWKSATVSFVNNVRENAAGGTDKRKPAIFMTLGDFYPELMKAQGGYTYNIVLPNPSGVGNLEEQNSLLNNIKKYVVGSREDVGVPVNNQAVPLNQYMLRLADVYLIYAEAAIGTAASTSDAKALEYYNAVRTRAGLAPRQGNLTFEQVFNERRVEFGMEGINWLDVKRFYYRNPQGALAYLNGQNRAVTYERAQDASGNPVGEANSFEGYRLVQPETPVVITEAYMELPIPNAEVSQNPLLAPTAEAVAYEFE
ncbi:RagB/SusD family nutrient uptake outer membrane protein [Pontibacter akesuensis]|uniref:Starch-binding associating with outer membrane n=1 Tax=Pontibacter akesuensis TaxID=388950 RepID=A0A1I7KXH0_9BACT|nr:RagB/SusD family nutrient uptake outer membrane protein [Pontibacter akesuensis]GHA78500.1 membrane protein [Pontibacter akesuensis]SFV02159.1 Starch-binding associating with outer membrane [Pontibacter akesuensis]